MNWFRRRFWYRESFCLWFRGRFRFGYFRFRRFRRRSDFGRLVAIQTPQRLLVESLFETRDPATALFRIGDVFARFPFLPILFGRFGLFEIDNDSFRSGARLLRVGENVERFGESAPFCPIERVEAEIVALLRISAGQDELSNNVRVSEDYREDERGLAAAGSFVDVSAGGK